MDSIKVLEEIGLQKISKETHIELKYLKYMIDGEFEKLNRINTLGFIKILSRDYKVDLSGWVQAFEEYWSQNRANPEEDQKLFIVAKSDGKSKKIIFFVLILVIIIAVGLYAFLTKEQIISNSYTPTITYNETEVVKDTQQEMSKLEEQIENQEPAQLPIEELNTTKEEIVQEVQPQETLTQEVQEDVKQEIKQELAAVPTDIPETEKVSETFESQAVITPNVELWVGVIYLDNFQRRSYLGEGNFSVDLSRDQIITTGHGSFNLKGKNADLEYKRQSPVRFLVKDGSVTEISWSKFKELNRGNPW